MISRFMNQFLIPENTAPTRLACYQSALSGSRNLNLVKIYNFLSATYWPTFINDAVKSEGNPPMIASDSTFFMAMRSVVNKFHLTEMTTILWRPYFNVLSCNVYF